MYTVMQDPDALHQLHKTGRSELEREHSLISAYAESAIKEREQSDYTVGWICALPIEASAAMGMLDETHVSLPQAATDSNNYTLGRIGVHNAVIACLPAGIIGNNSAATVAAQVRSTFTSLRFGLMVGIGGGVPSEENDIRLGDVVVSQPVDSSSW